jgi:tryptophan synthase beta subunit
VKWGIADPNAVRTDTSLGQIMLLNLHYKNNTISETGGGQHGDYGNESGRKYTINCRRT